MESINKKDVEFVTNILRERHYHFSGDKSMKSMNEIPSIQGLPDPYPWLESWEDFPFDAFLSWGDVQKIMKSGGSVTTLAPQCYTEIVTLTSDHEMIQNRLFYKDNETNMAVSGTGGDCWLKPTESLAKYFRSMV